MYIFSKAMGSSRVGRGLGEQLQEIIICLHEGASSHAFMKNCMCGPDKK